jgi:hypothetical protein
MSFLYLLLKIYPIIGVALGVLCFDLSRSLKQKGNKGYIGLIIFSVFWFLSATTWVVFRGDKNSDRWYRDVFGATSQSFCEPQSPCNT